MKQIPIVQLLEWAYRHELPKAERPGGGMSASAPSSWGMVYNLGILGTVIDAPLNQWGVVPSFMDDGDPHPDALTVARAVAGLASARIDVPAGWCPFPEWQDDDGLIATAVNAELPRLAVRDGATVRALISSVAMTGRRLDWSAEEPTRRMVERAGRPVWFIRDVFVDELGREIAREVDGFDQRRRRPKPGAYRKMALSSSIAGDIASRFDRQIWALGVRHVRRAVAGELTAHALTDDVPTLAPWLARSGVEMDPSHVVSLLI